MTAEGSERPAPAAAPERFMIDPIHPTLLWSFCRFLCRVYAWLMCDLKVYGIENVPTTGGVLLVTNHASYLDPILIGVKVRRPMSYFAKSELFENRFFGWLILNLRAFPVKQGAGDIGAVREAVARLKEGHMLNIFPEGSRTPDGKLQRIQSGVALIVKKSGVPIVPCYIQGSYEAWPIHKKLPIPAPVRVLIGKPLAIEGLKSDEIVKLIGETFVRMSKEIETKF